MEGQTDVGQSDPYVPQCFAGVTKCDHHFLKKKKQTEDGMAGLQSKFQNLNAKVNQG